MQELKEGILLYHGGYTEIATSILLPYSSIP